MALISIDGIYKDGRVELSELPEGVAGSSRVIVTFLNLGEPEPASPDRRTGGQLRGKIRIADDFDTLPDDVAEAFGMGSG